MVVHPPAGTASNSPLRRGIAPQSGGAADHAAGVFHRQRTVLAEEDRTVQIHHLAELTHEKGGRHGQGGAYHVPHHDIETETLRLERHCQGLGESTAFIELDVHHLESSDQCRDIGEPLYALVRRERYRRIEAVEQILFTDSTRLLD